MRRRLRLTSSISVKVTQQDYEQMEALAGDQGINVWARTILLREAAGPDRDHVALMMAVQSLRHLLLHGLPWLAPQHLRENDGTKPHEVRLLEDLFRRVIQNAETNGRQNAIALLAGVKEERS